MNDTDTRDLARALGWFSLGLGLAEVLAGRSLGRALGMEGSAGLLRGFGLREIATGTAILTQPAEPGWIWARVGGDALDLAALATGLRPGNRRRGRVAFALAAVAGITLLDVLVARRLDAEGWPFAARARGVARRVARRAEALVS